MKKNLLRTLCLCFALLTVLTLVPWQPTEAATATFTDVPTNSTYYKAVTYLSNNGILNGYGNGKFGLTDSIKREDMVTLLWRIAGEPGKGGNMVYQKGNFTDNPSGTYYYFALRWAKDQGLAAGYTDGSFGVGKKMKNTEAIQFIYNFAKSVVGRYGTIASPVATSTVNSRTAAYPTWAQTSAKWAYKNRIATLAYYPTSDCTRGDVALMLYNYYKQYQKNYALVIQSEDAHGNPKDGKVHNEVGSARANKFVDVVSVHVLPNCVSNLTVVTHGSARGTSHITETLFNSLLDEAFGKAKCIDMCYLMINSHGYENGEMALYGVPEYLSGNYLTPQKLHNKIKNRQGQFVVYLEVCYAGKYVDYFSKQKSKAIIFSTCDSDELATGFGQPTVCPDGTLLFEQAVKKNKRIFDTKNNYSLTVNGGNRGNKTCKITCTGNADGYNSPSEFKNGLGSGLTTTMRCYAKNPNYCIFGTP